MSFDLALIDSDLQILATGDVKTVSDSPKLRQDILKIILTPIGGDRFHNWYGSNISDNIIGQNLSDDLVFGEISSEISNSLERLKSLQMAQSTYQKVTLAELISGVQEIVVQRGGSDPRIINVIVKVLAKNLSQIEEVFTLRG